MSDQEATNVQPCIEDGDSVGTKYSNTCSPSTNPLDSTEPNQTANTRTDSNQNCNQSIVKCPTFKKRKKKSKSKQILKSSASNHKKRSLNDSNDDSFDPNPIQNAPIESTKRRKLNPQNPNEFSSKKASKSDAISAIHSYVSDRSVLPSGLEGQGAVVPVYVETIHDTRSEIEKKPSVTCDGRTRYQGLKSQRDTRNDKSKPIKKAPKFLGIGPQRAPDNVKITCRFDYQPDICKDWKETGFCGYGASCKFLHDRGDYKAGWQIERDWQKFEKKKNEILAGINHNTNAIAKKEEENWEINSSEDEEERDADGLPFACYICRDGFTDPVMTKCGHYFCSDCAIKKFAKSDACGVCGTKTGGSFQTATKLVNKLRKRK